VARSTKITWSRDVDEVFGTHKFTVVQIAGLEEGKVDG
jgi:hypothetical protein